MALSMVQLHLLAQEDQNEVQNDFLGYVVPLALVLAGHESNGIKIGITAFLTSGQSKRDAAQSFGNLMPMALASVSHDANSITNGTNAFPRL